MVTLAITFVVYYTVVLLIGLLRFRQQNASDYITAPSRTGIVPLSVSLLATIVGGGMFLGVAQEGYNSGSSVVSLGIAYLCGSVAFGWFAPVIRRYASEKGITTLFGLLDAIYPSSAKIRISTVFAWCTLVVFVLMLSVQFVSIAIFLSYYWQIHYDVTIMVAGAIVGAISIPIYTAFGGFRRDIFTDIVQMVLVVGGICVLISFIGISGCQAKIASLPDSYFSFGGEKAVFFVGALLLVAPAFFVRFDLWQRAITARSDGEARWAFIASGLASVPFFIVFGLAGMYGKAIGVTEAKFAGLAVIQSVVDEPWRALLVASFFAAVMSSADTFLGVAGLSFARATVYRKGEMEKPEQSRVSVAKLRIVTMIIGIVAIILAFVVRDIMDLFASAFGVLLVFLPSLAGGILRKSPGQKECWWSIGIGLGMLIPLTFVIPSVAFIPGAVVSAIAYLISARACQSKAVERVALETD